MAKRRGKGNGYIFKRGSVYYLQYDINGQRKTVSLKCTHRENKIDKDGSVIQGAEEKAKNLLEPIITLKTSEDVLHHSAKAKDLFHKKLFSLDDIWGKFEKHPSRKQCGEKTLKLHKYRINKFLNWLRNNAPHIKSLSDVTDVIAKQYAIHLNSTNISGKTYNETIASLRMIFKLFSAEAGIVNNPFKTEIIAKKDAIPKTRKEFSQKELIKILQSFDTLNIKDAKELEVLFHLGAWTGLRLKDCALMQWLSIDFASNLIQCAPSKSRKYEVMVNIPMHPLLREKLLDAQEWQENEYVLPNIAKRYNRNSISIIKAIKKILTLNGFATTEDDKEKKRLLNANVYGFHSFRHSFVSFCAKAGVPMAVVQEIVGHKNPAMTKHYTHTGIEEAKRAINALPMGEIKSISMDENMKRDEINSILNNATSEQLVKILDFSREITSKLP